MEFIPSEDVAKIIEMTRKGLEYYIRLLHKALAGSERIDSNLEKSSIVANILSDSIACYRYMACERVN